jgi:hypothetical protein
VPPLLNNYRHGPPDACRVGRAVVTAAKGCYRLRVFVRRTQPHLRHMEPEHLCLSPRGAPSKPQRNGRHAPAPPKSCELWHVLLGTLTNREPSGADGERDSTVVARLSLKRGLLPHPEVSPAPPRRERRSPRWPPNEPRRRSRAAGGLNEIRRKKLRSLRRTNHWATFDLDSSPYN